MRIPFKVLVTCFFISLLISCSKEDDQLKLSSTHQAIETRDAPCNCGIGSFNNLNCTMNFILGETCPSGGTWTVSFNGTRITPLSSSPTTVTVPIGEDGTYCAQYNAPGCSSNQRCIKIKDCLFDPCDCDGSLVQSINDPCTLVACPGPECAGPGVFVWTLPDGQQITKDQSSSLDCGELQIEEDGKYCVKYTDGSDCFYEKCITTTNCEPCVPEFNFLPLMPQIYVSCSQLPGKYNVGVSYFSILHGNACCCSLSDVVANLIVTTTVRNITKNKDVFVDTHNGTSNHCRSQLIGWGKRFSCVSGNTQIEIGDKLVGTYSIEILTSGCPYDGPNPYVGSTDIYVVKSSDLDPCCF